MFSDKICTLRLQKGYSQEKFAEKLGMSRQAVQLWENGTARPGLENLIKIAKVFNVSMDWLNDLSEYHTTDSMRHQSGLAPSYADLAKWECYAQDLHNDYMQFLDEGRDVSDIGDIVQAVSEYRNGLCKKQLADVLFSYMYGAPQREDYTYKEPDDLHEIRMLRTDKQFLPFAPMPDKAVLKDKIKAAWRGRVSGCLLGVPVECIHTNELWELLKRSDNYPMHRYITSKDVADPYYESFTYSLRRPFQKWGDSLNGCFPGDDDINFTVGVSTIIERYGLRFTSVDVCRWWKEHHTLNAVATAEKVALRNMIAGYQPPETALYQNPFREWIGAQIRADYYGYINPGDPEMAAEMAWRDARVSHVKNGIYGAMFVAAMLAGAFLLEDPMDVVQCGLSQIPTTSRLYERIQNVCTSYNNGMRAEEFAKDFYKRYDEYRQHDAIHTISNAEIVAACLLYGERDFTKSICMAVQFGFDTDCNGATVGSIVGMMLGTSGIGAEWTDPWNDRVEPWFKYHTVSTEEMASLAMKHIERKRQDLEYKTEKE